MLLACLGMTHEAAHSARQYELLYSSSPAADRAQKLLANYRHKFGFRAPMGRMKVLVGRMTTDPEVERPEATPFVFQPGSGWPTISPLPGFVAAKALWDVDLSYARYFRSLSLVSKAKSTCRIAVKTSPSLSLFGEDRICKGILVQPFDDAHEAGYPEG